MAAAVLPVVTAALRPDLFPEVGLRSLSRAMLAVMLAAFVIGGAAFLIALVASYVPFWSPFLMVTRLTVGRVEPGELLLSLGILIGTILVIGWVAIRVYAAGVLLYGQRLGLGAIARAVRQG